MRRVAAVIMVFLLFSAVPSSARADWRQFIPKFRLPTADLSVNAAYLSTDTEGPRDLSTETTFLRERLLLSTSAYIYHPNFITMGLAAGVGLTQENFRSSEGASEGWRRGFSRDYSFSLTVLPRHPYSFSAFASRSEYEMNAEGDSNVENPKVSTTAGATFLYKKKPYLLNLRYVVDSLETNAGTTTVALYSASGTYVKEYTENKRIFVNGRYEHRTFSTPLSEDGNSNNLNLSAAGTYRWVTLTGSAGRGTFEQETSGLLYRNKDTSVGAGVNVLLPWRFNADLQYTLQKNATNSFNPGGEDLTSDSKRLIFTLTHQLYQSLKSTYVFQRSSTSGVAGDTEQNSHGLTFNYTKKIGGDGRLESAVTLTRTDQVNSGITVVISEPHAAVTVPGSFTLIQKNVDLGTLQVFLKSPLSTNELFLLQENVDYLVTTIDQTIQITILNLPSQFILPGNFDFTVTYAVNDATFKVRNQSFGFSIGAGLFHGLLFPSYSYSESRSETLAGVLPAGEASEMKTHTAGINVRKAPFGFSLQYQKSVSNINESSSWTASLDFNKNLSDTARFYAVARYGLRKYPQGSSLATDRSFTEKNASVAANLMKSFFDRRLTITAGGSYAVIESVSKASAYGVNANAMWKIGKMMLTFGASISRSESDANLALDSGAFSRTTHTRKYYFFNLRRRLF